MGRGRGKGKKQTITAVRGDLGKGEKILALKRRGRPHKTLKDKVDELEQIDKVEDFDENAEGSIMSRSLKNQMVVENGTRKRKCPSEFKVNADLVKETADLVKEELVPGGNSGTEESIKSVGCRPSGHRRKGKPHRAPKPDV